MWLRAARRPQEPLRIPCGGLGADGTFEVRNDAFLDPDLDRFNEALKDYLAAGWRGFKVTPRDGADKNAPEGPRPQDRPPADTADDHSASDDDGTEGTEPALPFGEDRGAA